MPRLAAIIECMRVQSLLTSRPARIVVFLVCLVPAALLYWRWGHHLLGPNWIEKAQRFTGDWILRFLMFTLLVSPFRKIPGMNWLIRYRRMLGLFAFFYACVHFTIYLWFDKALDWHEIYGDFTRRVFYIVGLAAFVLLIPLALTSTAGWIRRLGGRRWQMLHRLIYVSALAGALHYYLQGKSIVLNAVYTGLFIVLLVLWRAGMWLGKKAHQ